MMQSASVALLTSATNCDVASSNSASISFPTSSLQKVCGAANEEAAVKLAVSSYLKTKHLFWNRASRCVHDGNNDVTDVHNITLLVVHARYYCMGHV
jgi:hypothetical protein